MNSISMMEGAGRFSSKNSPRINLYQNFGILREGKGDFGRAWMGVCLWFDAVRKSHIRGGDLQNGLMRSIFHADSEQSAAQGF